MSKKIGDLFNLFLILGICVNYSLSESFRGHVYHGIIKEDASEGDNVELDSPLYVRKRNGLDSAEEICGYTLYKAPADLPFKTVLLEPLTGSAKIVVADGSHLDYEKRHHYSFEISAHDCTIGRNMVHSERELVLIEVEDMNDHRPIWASSSFFIKADEGRIYDQLVRFDAMDADGSDAFSKICHYHIGAKDVPFEANSKGYLHNTEPLDYQKRQRYTFQVTAEDCGGLVSDAVTVTVVVNPVCVPHWIGISNRVDFVVGTHLLLLAPEARLDICNSTCNLTRVSVSMKLDTSHVEKDCDKDRASVKSQLKLCGASNNFIDLPSLGVWAANRSQPGKLNNVLEFDGTENAVIIPSEKFHPNLGTTFTILVWMKHSEDSTIRYDKEHIICHSDGEAMNRHHYSLYVHNCHLIFLLRRESDEKTDLSHFLSTEWKWKLEEVCDGNWHQYAISLDLQEVRLYVDGRRFVESRHNPVVIDNWPLHPTKFVRSTKLVVGACWHGRDQSLGEYFHGQLAGLLVLVNGTETDQVLHCLPSCQEKLDFTRLDDMESGTAVSLNSEMSSVTISGESARAVQSLLQRVGYVNTRLKPATGHRPLTMSTNMKCSNEEQLMVAAASVLVTVVEYVQPVIALRVPLNHLLVDEDKLIKGEKLFNNLSMIMLDQSSRLGRNATDQVATSEEEVAENPSKIDSCLVQVDSSLNQSYERFQFPNDLISRLGLTVDVSEDGIVISGVDVLWSYEQAISSVEYVNTKPEDMRQRSFTLRCTEWSGQFISNQLDVTLVVVHVNRRVTVIPDALGNEKFVHTAVHKLGKPTKDTTPTSFNSQEIGIGMAVMIVLCIGTLVVVTVLGAVKLRTVHSQRNDVGVDDKPEMEWDNSALTITVNPMEQELYDEPTDECSYHSNDTEDSEEETTVHDNPADDSDGEVEGTEKVARRDLEWDDSTLTY